MTNEMTVEPGATITIAPYVPTPPKAIDFEKIEAVRKHMLLTVNSLVTIFGTTRVSYYNWLKGGKMRKATADHIRKVTRKLLTVMTQHGWPYDLVFVASQPERLKMLQDLIENLDKEPTSVIH